MIGQTRAYRSSGGTDGVEEPPSAGTKTGRQSTFAALALELCWIYILYARSDAFVFVISLGPITFDERDVVLVASLVFAAMLGRAPRAPVGVRSWSQLLLRVFVAIVAVRSLAMVAEHGKVGVFSALHQIMYLLLIPGLYRFVDHYGWQRLLRFLFNLSYVAAGIAISAYILLRAGLFHTTSDSILVLIQHHPDVTRPGAEFLIPFALAASPLRRLYTSRGKFIAGTVLLLGELFCSQTLSLVIGAGVGLVGYVVFVALRTRASSDRQKSVGAFLSIVALAMLLFGGLLLVSPGTVSSTTARFDIEQRTGTESVIYRKLEQKAATDVWLHQSAADKIFGPGPGTVISFMLPNGQKVVKIDTHDSYLTVGLQFGFLGDAAYILLLLSLIFRAARNGDAVAGASIAAGILAVAVTSATAPFLTVYSGWALLGFFMAIDRGRGKSRLNCGEVDEPLIAS